MQFNYHIEGMHCAACTDKIKTVLSPYFKITDVTLNPPVLTIEADKQPSLSDLNNRISQAGNYTLYTDSGSLVEAKRQPGHSHHKTSLRAYYPIFLIAAYIILVATI